MNIKYNHKTSKSSSSSSAKRGKPRDSRHRPKASSHKFNYRTVILIILFASLLALNATITKHLLVPLHSHYQHTNVDETEDRVRPIEGWKWMEANRDCPILGIADFHRNFPSKSSVSRSQAPSLVIAVTSSSANKDRMIAQLQGWASSVEHIFHASDLFFSVDRHVPEIPTDLTWISPDERARPPSREGAQWRSLRALNESIHRAPRADWILSVEDDAFVNTFALRDFLDGLDPGLPAVYGYMFMHPKWNRSDCWISGGAGMLLQRRAAIRVMTHFEDCFDRRNDVTIGCAARRAGVPLVHSELFSLHDNSFHQNRIHMYTMVTLHGIDPYLQVEMFADLRSYRLSSGLSLGNVTITRPSDLLLSSQESAPGQSSIRNPVNWNGYRLGDGVKMYDKNGVSNRMKVCERWPDSVLCEYLKYTTEANHIAVLAYIVNRRNSIHDGHAERPSLNTTVVHLRIGDGLCGMYDLGSWGGSRCKGAEPGSPIARIPDCWENETDCFVDEHGALYAFPKEYYEPVAEELLEAVGNKTRVVVLADPYHWTRNQDLRNGDYSIDYSYRDRVISFFVSRGFKNAEVRHGSTPDDDFLYMSSAKNFVRGGGGYSRLISSVVIANGGRVFQPKRRSSL
ncbi:hypothetical protein ACHAWX_007615 [Stephanocyclus meneghinianus]